MKPKYSYTLIESIPKIVDGEPDSLSNNNCLWIVRGIPGSGKTTFAKDHIIKRSYGHMAWCEADMFFMKNKEYNFDPTMLRQAHERCFRTISAGMHNTGCALVSNTFTMTSEINPYVNLALRHHAAIRIYTMENEFGNIHGVPDSKIQLMKDRMVSHKDMVAHIKKSFREYKDANQ